MNRTTQVMVVPADKNPFGEVLLMAASEGDKLSVSFAKPDGTFTDRRKSSLGAYEAISFQTDEDAIAWAEAWPRNWQVLNKEWVGKNKANMPTTLTVQVTDAAYNPFLHKTVEARRAQGEPITQISVHFELLHWEPASAQRPSLGGCHIVIDREAIDLLAAAGISKPEALEGHMLVLHCEDPHDLMRPLVIWNVI